MTLAINNREGIPFHEQVDDAIEAIRAGRSIEASVWLISQYVATDSDRRWFAQARLTLVSLLMGAIPPERTTEVERIFKKWNEWVGEDLFGVEKAKE